MNTDTIPYGYCQCGCGGKTTVSTRNHTGFGWVKGEPKRFIKSHWGRTIPQMPWSEARWHEEDRGSTTVCWIWDGAKDLLGYGRFRSKTPAYRYSYELVNGTIPPGLELDHLCRQPSCIRPEHLEAVTHAENLRRGANAKLTYELAAEIREVRQTTDLTLQQIGDRYGLCKRTIWLLVNNKTWVHVEPTR